MTPRSAGFHDIHAAYRPGVERYLRRLVGAADADDVAQLAFLKIERGLAQLRDPSSLGPWVYRIARRAALDWLRRRGPGGAPAGPGALDGPAAVEAIGDPAPSAESAWLIHGTRSCVRHHVERLPEPYRTPLLLSESEGKSDAEIARALDLTVGNVKIRLHRARRRLGQELRQHCSVYLDERSELACEPRAAAPAA